MNTNQNSNNQILRFPFAICGVKGFQSVAVKGSSVEKRMYSAINQMDKELKKHCEALQEKINTCGQDVLLDLNEQLRVADFATKIMYTVRNQFSLQQDTSHLEADLTAAEELSNQEFFDIASKVYAGNLEWFIANVREIDAGLDKHIAKQLSINGIKKINDVAPYLFLCSGSFFKDTNIPVILSGRTIDLLGEGIAVQAVHEACLRAIRSVKNFRLTDYLRAETDEVREKIRANILLMDEFAADIHNVRMESKGCLLAMPPTRKEPPSKHVTFSKITSALEMESEQRLMTYVISATKPKEPVGEVIDTRVE